jgi:hypothetical protein
MQKINVRTPWKRKTDKETAHGIGAGNVGAPATLGNFPPPIGEIGW